MTPEQYYAKQEELFQIYCENEIDDILKERINIEHELNGNMIYRYMNLPQFLYLITNKKLYLSCVKKWDDKYEFPETKLPVSLDLSDPQITFDYFSYYDIDENGKAFLQNPYYFKYDILGHIYGACFSKNSDSDSLWRIYSRNRDGVAVGFDVSSMGYLKACSLYSVIYYSKLFDGINTREEQLKDKIKYTILRFAYLKREYFMHEQEVRLISVDTKEMDHIDFDVDTKRAIRSIVLNPFCTNELFMTVNELCKKEIGIGATKSKLYENDVYDKMKNTIKMNISGLTWRKAD